MAELERRKRIYHYYNKGLAKDTATAQTRHLVMGRIITERIQRQCVSPKTGGRQWKY